MAVDLRHEQPLREAHLRRRQADALVKSHEHEHLVQNIREPTVEPLHGMTPGAQKRVRVQLQTQRTRARRTIRVCPEFLDGFTC